MNRGNLMTLDQFGRGLGLAIFLYAALGAAASVADDSGQTPPAKADETSPKACITETSDFRMTGKTPTFVTTLENKCERRFRCRVNVYVTTAKGPTQGQATLILGPHAAGEAAKKSYVLKIKMTSGSAEGARECTAM
jgi:hypothetical protein